MNTYRILVFGSTGVGKTSLCNTFTGTSQPRDVSSDVYGTTFETYTYGPVTIQGDTFYITDTVGLNGSKLDEITAEHAATQLLELLHQAEDGFNLLIHVFKGKRDQLHDNNYDFFVKGMTKESIPTLLVATGCENEVPMCSWADRNQANLKEGCKYEKVIASCFVKGATPEREAIYAPLREESQQELLTSILEHALPEPKKINMDENGDIGEIFIKLWNRFIELARLPDKVRRLVNGTVYTVLISQGVPEHIAYVLTERDGVLDNFIHATADNAGKAANIVTTGINDILSKIKARF